MNWILFEIVNNDKDIQYTNDILVKDNRVGLEMFESFKAMLFGMVPHIQNKREMLEELDKFNRIFIEIKTGEWKILPFSRGNYSFHELVAYNEAYKEKQNTKNSTYKGAYDRIFRT